MLSDQESKFFKIFDNFKIVENVVSIPIVKSKSKLVPKFTIAIPTYKRTSFLKEALDSALQQINFTDYEVIVLDNNPERGCETEKLIQNYQDCRLSYFKNSQNIGMVNNWNKCFLLSNGSYITILHDDDLLNLNYLKEVDKILLTKNVIDLLFVSVKSFSQKNEIDIQKSIVLGKRRLNKIITFDFLSGSNNPGTVGVLIRKEKAIALGGFNILTHPTADYAFWVNFIENSKNTFKLHFTLAYYRWSVNESLKIETLEGFIKNEATLKKGILEKNDPYAKQLTHSSGNSIIIDTNFVIK